MKKLITLALAIFMIFALSTAAIAAPTSGTIDTVEGSITINDITLENGAPTATYEIYQILKLKSFDFTTGSYFYEYTDDAWKDFFTTGEGKDYIGINDKGLIEWKGSSDAERVANFSKLALAYAEANDIPPTRTTANGTGYEVTGEKSIAFKNLELGYYLVDSTVGALCGLSTTNPDGIINSKNGVPTLEKQVREDLSQQWGESNSADIGQDVDFRITIHVHDGAQNYVLHDTMSEGLTFKETTVAVKVLDGSTGKEQDYAAAGNYDVVKISDHEFKVVFTEGFCNGLNTNDRLVITYSAMLNRNAFVGNGTATNPANENKAILYFGENHTTNEDTTTTKTYGFDLVKTDGQNKLLDGSEFRIYSEATGGVEVTVVPLLDADGNQIKTDDGYNMYRKARADETGNTVIVVKGKVRVIGLDNGVYWLEETKAPAGYNAITSRQKFTIADNNLDAIITSGIVSTNSGVQVINNTGSMLPETGGMGTLIFTILGTLVVLASGVVLVTKKRMSMIKDAE